jgi:ATP-binding cassette subfamily C protein
MIKLSKILFSFFNNHERRFFCGILLLMISTAIVELLGIGSLFPYIKILGDQHIIHQNAALKFSYQFFHFRNDNHYLIFVGTIIFAMILLKGWMSSLNNYYQSKFSYGLNNRLSRFCLKSFLSMPYSDYININSAVLSKHLLVDVAGVSSIISSVLTMLTDIIVAAALIGLMIWADPMLVLFVVTILCGFLWLTMHGTKDRIRNLARSNEACNRQVYKTAAEALLGLKDIKIYNVEAYFTNRFLNWQRKISDQMIEFNVISNVPGIAMNVMGFGVLLVILLYLIITKGNLAAILPIIGLIAVCVQRLLPAANRISSSIGLIRRYKPVVFIVRNAIDALNVVNNKMHTVSNTLPTLKFTTNLALKNIYYTYPNTSRYALNDVSLSIKKNTSLGIVGESGAGKSTLVDVLLGLLPIQQGSIWCDAIDITQCEHAALSRLVGYVPQQTFLIDGTIRDNIAFGIAEDKIDITLLDRAIRVAQLYKLINELPDGIHTQIGEHGVKLSGGQRQRLGIARALYHDPEILIMDEATNALDSATEKEFNEALQNLMKEKTVIIIAHRLSSIQMCDEIIQLEQGQIVARGSYEHLLQTSEKFRYVYNI